MKTGNLPLVLAATATVICAGMSLAQADDLRPKQLAPLGPPPIPPDNPQTDAKIELGKMLFFDPRLGGDGSISCASCHVPSAGWGFPEPLSLGYTGTVHWRNSQTIVNSAYYGSLFWAGSAKSLEDQAKKAAGGAVGGNGEADMMEARLAFVPEYRKRFREVFGDIWPRIGNAWMAIAAFERTLVQRDTPFDKHMQGDDKALTDQQKRGLKLFAGKAGCIQCHNGALVSDQKYHNIGVPSAKEWETDGIAQVTFRYELYAKGSTQEMYRKTKDDPGVYFRTKEANHKGKFRTPSLRYTKYTAPYMHNGALATLEDVVAFYNAGGGTNEFSATKSKLLKPLKLSKEEQGDLVAFLESMSGPEIEMEEPDLPDYAPLPLETN